MNSEVGHPREYGVLLPHFGERAGREALLDGALLAESAGFDAVWVRDHVVFHPHHHEGQDRTFVDPFVVLSAVAAVTESITLGTGCLIPHRHPVHTALLLGSLAKIAGSDRVIVGFGLGSFDHEFEIVGMGGWDRRVVIEEQVEILRKMWTGKTVSHDGEYYEFSDADIHPTPQRNNLPIWYAGTSLASVRRAAEYCDGWMPGRMPRRSFKNRVQRLAELAHKAGKPMPATGVIPYVSPGKTKGSAVSTFDLGGLIEEARNRYTRPDGGEITELEDLDGALIAGPPEQIASEVLAYHDVGCDHFIFDLRLRFHDWLETLQMIGEEVVPLLRRESAW
ncbi:MAG: TIGR03619 family F420-dependent LLM class oxidoreductase [Acidimicrobiia bacterium]|nr:TIGR03619 family F420-dependent LLM class oxidoreductase [Acidimicrobiia bacterium]